MKKKVLFFIPNLKHGGAEKVLVNLVNNLDKEKYDVTLQTLFDVGVHKKNLQSHIRYKSFFAKEFRGNSLLFKVFPAKVWWKMIVREHYDIAVSYLEGPTTRILSGCTDDNTKKVAWIHIELNSPELAALGFRNVEEARKAYQSFERIVSVSESVKACFLKNIKIHNSVNVLYNTNETEEIEKKSLIPVGDERFQVKDIISVCSVAKLMKTKGFDRLIDVHKKLLDEGFLHKIFILGIGEEKKLLESQIEKYGLGNSFILLGFRENPYQYVANCDLYVCSSRREGFSTAVTEALIVGTPVVSTDCSGAKELLGEHNEYGIVVENNTDGIYRGLKQMFSNPETLEYYRNQAKIRGTYFSKERTVKAVEEMLDRL